MSTERRNNLAEIMNLAWQFVKRNGLSMSEALKQAWLNSRVKKALRKGIVQFFFKKVDGSVRQAFGTLSDSILPPTAGNGRKPSDSVQVYFDTEKSEFRCFKKINLLRMA